MTSSLPVMDILYLARLLAWLESYVWLQGVRDDDCHNVGRWRFARFGTRVLRSLRTHGLRRRAWTSVGYVMAAADIFAQLQFLHIFYRVSSPLSPQIKRAAQLNFPAIDTCYNFFQHVRNITCTIFLIFSAPLHSLLRLSTTKSQWLNAFLHTARKQWHIKKCNYWSWVTKVSRVQASPHFHQNCTHGVLHWPCIVQWSVSFSLTALNWAALSHLHFHTSQSVLIESIVGFIRVFVSSVLVLVRLFGGLWQ